MILRQHGVFLAYLLLMFVWNTVASAREGGPGWERRVLLPLQGLLTAALVRDRLLPGQASLLGHPVLRWAFPAAFAAAAVQNVLAIRARGARLADIPIVLANVGLGACVALAAVVLGGAGTGEREGVLLYDYSLLQQLLGSPQAYLSTLSWHVPVLAPRRPASSIGGLLASLLVPALCGFIVLVLVAFRGEAAGVLERFHLEPRAQAVPRTGLATGVLARIDGEQLRGGPGGTGGGAGGDAGAGAAFAGAVPGSLAAWVLPADHDGAGLPTPQRPLVLALAPPGRWAWSRPARADVIAVFLDGAERLARRLQPAVLLPFPEPDGEATLLLGAETGPDEWRSLLGEAARRVRVVSPSTRLAARLAGTGERSHALFTALSEDPPVVDILGPRLIPGGGARGGPALADETLATWARWRQERTASPALWVLSAGLSPLAYGDWAQSRFIEGCWQRAQRDPAIEGLLFEGWTDRGHTLGLSRGDGSLRPAGERLVVLLAAQDARAATGADAAPPTGAADGVNR